MTEAEFLDDIWVNSVNAALLLRLRSLELRECHLTAGCLFQAVWNRLCGRAAQWGVKDYDVFYFDDADMSRSGIKHGFTCGTLTASAASIRS